MPTDSTDDLTRRALAVNQALLALGHETFEAGGALFVRDRAVPRIRDANHVTAVTASTPQEVDRLLARAEREFAGFPHRRFDVDPGTPPAFQARLALEGYGRDEALVMVLEGEPRGEPQPCEIRPVEDEAGWAAHDQLHRLDWSEYTARLGRAGDDPDVADEMMRNTRGMSPPVRFWLACVDGQPRAYLSSWEGIDGVGQVESLFTHPDFRHRGLATALIHHGVADCRARLGPTGPVVIVADPSDTPKQMYAAMGFRPVAIKRNYWKALS